MYNVADVVGGGPEKLPTRLHTDDKTAIFEADISTGREQLPLVRKEGDFIRKNILYACIHVYTYTWAYFPLLARALTTSFCNVVPVVGLYATQRHTSEVFLYKIYNSRRRIYIYIYSAVVASYGQAKVFPFARRENHI